MTIPFTYSIYCIPTKQYYYGVKYSKNCTPDELWTTYFTSSKYVKDLIRQYGVDAFRVKIRKKFKTTKAARAWELKVIRRLRAAVRDDFINKGVCDFIDGKIRIWINNGVETKFIDSTLEQTYLEQGWRHGRLFDAGHRNNISKAQRGNKYCVGRKISEETRQKHRNNRKQQSNIFYKITPAQREDIRNEFQIYAKSYVYEKKIGSRNRPLTAFRIVRSYLWTTLFCYS